MKFSSILCFSALMALGLFTACNNDSEAAKNTPADGTAMPSATAPGTDADAGAPLTEPAQNAQGLWHYTCSKGCAGGAGSAIACATCGETLMHSQTYHGAPQQAPTGSMTPPTGGATTPQMTPPAATKPEPPQNAAGVWHYTCASGCGGGAGAATTCSTCGKALTHNTSYHK